MKAGRLLTQESNIESSIPYRMVAGGFRGCTIGFIFGFFLIVEIGLSVASGSTQPSSTFRLQDWLPRGRNALYAYFTAVVVMALTVLCGYIGFKQATFKGLAIGLFSGYVCLSVAGGILYEFIKQRK